MTFKEWFLCFVRLLTRFMIVMVGFREHPLLLCLFIFQIFSGVVYAVSCATETKTVVDKEYIDGYGYSHHSYEIRVCTETYFEEHYNWVEVTPTEYNNYEIGDEYIEE